MKKSKDIKAFNILSYTLIGLVALICLIPLLVTGFLVVPIPNYHNILTLIREIIDFFYGRRNYKWEGWCYKNEYK